MSAVASTSSEVPTEAAAEAEAGAEAEAEGELEAEAEAGAAERRSDAHPACTRASLGWRESTAEARGASCDPAGSTAAPSHARPAAGRSAAACQPHTAGRTWSG